MADPGSRLGGLAASTSRDAASAPFSGADSAAVERHSGSTQAVMNRGLDWQTWNGWGYINYALVAIWSVALIGISVYSGSSAWINRFLSTRPLVELGKYSYAAYLFHIPLDAALRKLGVHPTTVLKTIPYAAMLTAMTFGLALLTWNLMEERCHSLEGSLVRLPMTTIRF